jgi:nucleotide-binding universal stress UspA family protein
MFAHTLPDYYSSAIHRGPAIHDRPRSARPQEHVRDAATPQPANIGDLLVVLSDSEPHRDVALRAQLLARDTPVSRTVLLIPDTSTWQRFIHTISRLGNRLSAFGTGISARILQASFPRERTRVGASAHEDEIVGHAKESDLVIVGRRRAFPWLLAPLSRYVRRMLRRTRTPVLVVGSTPTRAYRNVVIATDLETDIGPALKWVQHVAPQASLTFLHVYRGLFESKLQSAGVPNGDILNHRFDAQRKAAVGLSDLLNRHQSVPRGVLAHGWASHDVFRKARELGADLIVVVKSTHSWWAEVLGASVSLEVATHADRDVLVVHA